MRLKKMRRMQLIKLLVVSKKTVEAKEITFNDGLNIILGENKTGKSSLIKSIFYTLGCEVPFEKEWTDLISDYFLIFNFDSIEYTIHKSEKKYSIWDNERKYFLITKASYTDFCKEFMEIFKIKINMIDKKSGEKRPLPPAAIFNYQYIDQDSGWNYKIPNSFLNLGYLKDVNNIIKYVVGEHNNKYFKVKAEIDKINSEITSYKKDIQTIKNFIKRVETINTVKLEFSDSNFFKHQLNNLNKLKSSISKKEEELNSILNITYSIKKSINYAKKIIHEAQADYIFSKKMNDTIICPTCGTSHKNELPEKLSIISDIDQTTHLLHSLRIDLKEIEREKKEVKSSLSNLKAEYHKLDKLFKTEKENISYINELKLSGKNELINANANEVDNMESILGKKLVVLDNLTGLIKNLESQKRKKQIRDSITEIFNTLANSLDFKSDKITFRTYKPNLKNSNLGSNGPRAVLAYYSSLYLYNLGRSDYPFKSLVIDTPNQQGQDYKNLAKIDKALSLLDSTQGQVILGTEREIGLESQVNLIKLTEKYKCLNLKDYTNNLAIISTFFDS